jgi:hypothetical protein
VNKFEFEAIIRKEIRMKTGKQAGDKIRVTIEEKRIRINLMNKIMYYG